MNNTPFRLTVIGVVALSLFGALFIRLWYIQVLTNEDFTAAAASNRVRVVHEQAPRGRILDRSRNVLADNRQTLQITIDRQALGEATEFDEEETQAVLDQLASELSYFGVEDLADENPPPMTGELVAEALVDNEIDPFRPVPVIEEVDPTLGRALEVFIGEHQDSLPGVDLDRGSARTYPYKSLAAHLLGYVGEINQDKLEEFADSPLNYTPGDEVGKVGVELEYEQYLRGQPGQTTLEVDAKGDIVRLIEEESFAAIPGQDLLLSIDIDVQAVAEEALREELNTRSDDNFPATAGSVVVLEPSDGSVVALASYPTYNPEEFVGGISTDRYTDLNLPENHFPLKNRAIQELYAPGSTFKLITSIAALRNGVVAPRDTFDDDGTYELQNCTGKCVFTNAGERAYGAVDLSRALTVSSDWYYYRLGEVFWLQREDHGSDAIQKVAREFGFGEDSGIGLPFEQEGLVSDPDFRRERSERYPDIFPFPEWFTGDNLNLAIGQGALGVTSVQLTNAFGTFANGGKLYEPRMALGVLDYNRDTQTFRVAEMFEPVMRREIEIPAPARRAILEGLLGVPRAEDGTALTAFAGFDLANWPVAGKTGTAEIDGKEDTSVFVAFGPNRGADQTPEYVVGAILEEAGFGADVAAPLVRRIMDPLRDRSSLPKAVAVDAYNPNPVEL